MDQGTRALKDLAEKQKPRDNNGGQGARNGRARGASLGTAGNDAASATASANESSGNQQAQRGQGVQRRPWTADEQAKYAKGECFLCSSKDYIKYNCP